MGKKKGVESDGPFGVIFFGMLTGKRYYSRRGTHRNFPAAKSVSWTMGMFFYDEPLYIHRAVDELYYLCEAETSAEHCEEAAKLLESCSRDFFKVRERMTA